MRKIVGLTFLVAAVLSLGCAITNYPVIYDTMGANGDAVMHSFYDPAYIVPSGQVATIWADGTDELFTLVTQDWTGDQWLYTYNNHDPSASVIFLQQTYCDPTFQENCRIVSAWNPDLPDAYPHGDQQAGYNNVDDPFDYILNPCPGVRSLSLLVSYTTRIGECGSGVWADKQGAAYEFSLLEKVNFRGQDFYHLPIDSSVASFEVSGQDGARATMPIFGRFNGYLDNQLRLALPVTSNAKYQLRWLSNWVANHGNAIDMSMTYGALNANFRVDAGFASNVLDQM